MFHMFFLTLFLTYLFDFFLAASVASGVCRLIGVRDCTAVILRDVVKYVGMPAAVLFLMLLQAIT